VPLPVLDIKNLSITFHSGKEKVEAVKGISFSLRQGRVLGIVGESGSGKSVTALSILQLLPKTQSRISAEGIFLKNKEKGDIDLLSLDEKEMQKVRGNRISMIFQEPMTSLNPVMRCGRQVVEAIRAHQKVTLREAKEEALRLFREVQLPRPGEIFRSYPHELSGGQKQRIMIAMAVASKPEILIADEPTTALDVTVQKAILELIRNLQQKYGMAVLFITHDLGTINAIADDVLVMKAGEIVESGPVSQIFNAPRHPYTKGLIACRPGLETQLEVLPTIRDFITNEGNMEVFSSSNVKKKKDEKDGAKEFILLAENMKVYFPSRSGKWFRKKEFVRAVDGVSLEIHPGETVGLVGESGCGKTTLGRSVLRLIEPSGGRVVFNSKELMELSFKELRRSRKELQIVFQDPYSSLNPRLTAGKAIMEPMVVHRLYENNRRRKEKVMDLLEKVGLEKGHFHRYPHEFSGGQRQRICIARALAVEPQLVICDESVSALDVSVQAQVLNLLNKLKKELGLTYLFISHDLSVVKFMSDRIIVMKEGRIEEEGDPEKIYRHPGSEYTKRLINAILE